MFEPKTYQYDRFGRFCRMATDNNLLDERMDANLNADVREPSGQPWLDGGKERLRDGGLNDYELPQFFAPACTANRTGFHLADARQSCPTIAKNFDELAKARLSARRLNSALCLWTQPDPLAQEFSNTNPLVYCSANPINFIDPTGKDGRIRAKFPNSLNYSVIYTHK